MIKVVDVDSEPHHVELLRNDHVRAYLATIEPGDRTLYHRHHADTLYVVITSGRYRSEDLGRQPQRVRLGRSTGIGTKLALAAHRATSGELRPPRGMVAVQYHHDFPLTHRLCAAAANRFPIRMLGVELLGTGTARGRRPAPPPGLVVEYQDDRATAYRLRPVGGQAPRLPTGVPALLVPVGGPDAGTVRWLAGSDLAGSPPEDLDGVLVTF